MRRRVVTVLIVLLLAWGGLVATAVAGITPELGLDLQGGTSVLLTAPEGVEPDVIDVAIGIMRDRIESFGGVQEPEISRSGDRTVLVQLPGVTDHERALAAIGQTGELSFRPVIETGFGPVSPLLAAQFIADAQIAQTTTTTIPGETTTTESGSTTTTSPPTTLPLIVLPEGVDPDTGLTISDDPTREAWLPEINDEGNVVAVYHVGPAQLLGADVADAIGGFFGANVGGGIGQWSVSLDLTSDGGDKFAALTAAAASYPLGDPRRLIAIVLDGEVISAPQVNQDVDPAVGIAGGQAQITMGSVETAETEAVDLAVVLRYGSLPVAFERSSVQKVSATLGSDSLTAGLLAGLGGLLLVALAVLLYYRALGLITVIGLTVFGSLLVTTFSLLGRYRGLTLTLAGVTGIIVSIGITADSYIVLFERIKEEIRKGRTIRSAAGEGFRRAFHTILTADTVSFLGAALLYLLAIGPVKGFALSLGIATALDVFVAYFFTRHMATIVAASPLGTNRIIGYRAAAAMPEEVST